MMLEKFQHLFIVIGSHRFGVPLDTEYFFFRMLHRFVDPVGSCRRSDKFGSRLFDCLVMKELTKSSFSLSSMVWSLEGPSFSVTEWETCSRESVWLCFSSF